MTTNKKQDALESIRWPLKAIRQEDARLHGYVQLARKEGASWTEIGKVIGISRQAAQQRFGKNEGALK
jgi:hypothetical protein